MEVDSDFLEIQLRPWKLIQRYSELSFFLTNKTNIPYGEKVSQIKLILRFSLMNSFRVSCLDTEREYIEPIKC